MTNLYVIARFRRCSGERRLTVQGCPAKVEKLLLNASQVLLIYSGFPGFSVDLTHP